MENSTNEVTFSKLPNEILSMIVAKVPCYYHLQISQVNTLFKEICFYHQLQDYKCNDSGIIYECGENIQKAVMECDLVFLTKFIKTNKANIYILFALYKSALKKNYFGLVKVMIPQVFNASAPGYPTMLHESGIYMPCALLCYLLKHLESYLVTTVFYEWTRKILYGVCEDPKHQRYVEKRDILLKKFKENNVDRAIYLDRCIEHSAIIGKIDRIDFWLNKYNSKFKSWGQIGKIICALHRHNHNLVKRYYINKYNAEILPDGRLRVPY